MKDNNGRTLNKGDKIKVTIEGSYLGQSYGSNNLLFSYGKNQIDHYIQMKTCTVIEKSMPVHEDGIYQGTLGGLYLKDGDTLVGIYSCSRYPVSDIDRLSMVRLVPEKADG
jgi:hypothetical protein